MQKMAKRLTLILFILFMAKFLISCQKCDHPKFISLEKGIERTCTTAGTTDKLECEACHKIFESEIIEAEGHHFNEENGNKCDVCNKTLMQCLANSYEYECLATLKNGEALQAFYNEIDYYVNKFHYDYSAEVYPDDTVGNSTKFVEFDYTKFGLTREECAGVVRIYCRSNPQYYWFKGNLSADDKEITFYVVNDYISGERRKEINEKIEEKFKNLTINEYSEYLISAYIHDLIISKTEYAYKLDGTPEDASWAHDIVGYLELGKVVCEGYARTFQLYLSYFNVDCIYVSGDTPRERHAWNLVKLEDDQWYWYDLTWDDGALSNSYSYFCVSYTESPLNDGELFKDTHRPSTLLVELYPYALPEDAYKPFDSSIYSISFNRYRNDNFTGNKRFDNIQLITVEDK